MASPQHLTVVLILLLHLCLGIPTEDNQINDDLVSLDIEDFGDNPSGDTYQNDEGRKNTDDYEKAGSTLDEHRTDLGNQTSTAPVIADDELVLDYDSLVSLVQSQAEDYDKLMSIVLDLSDEIRDLRQGFNYTSYRHKSAISIAPDSYNEDPSAEEEIKPDSWDNQGASSVYVRWGRDDCPSVATEVYSGFVAGTNQDLGGGANYLCMPDDPIYYRATAAREDRGAKLYGVDYETDTFEPFHNLYEHDPKCAVCETPGRSIVLMVPARNICPSGWTREYYGYLMTSHTIQRRSEFVCVDNEAEGRPGTAGENNGNNFFAVEGTCSNGGGLPCGPYEAGKELTCAVCTK